MLNQVKHRADTSVKTISHGTAQFVKVIQQLSTVIRNLSRALSGIQFQVMKEYTTALTGSLRKAQLNIMLHPAVNIADLSVIPITHGTDQHVLQTQNLSHVTRNGQPEPSGTPFQAIFRHGTEQIGLLLTAIQHIMKQQAILHAGSNVIPIIHGTV